MVSGAISPCLILVISSCADHHIFYSYFTRPDVPIVAYPEGFQGNEIPIDGELVARLCVERLSLSEEADD